MGFRPAKNFFANASLITQTCGAAAVSCGPNSRPRIKGMPTVEKYCGPTASKRENFSSCLLAFKPSTSTSSADSDEVRSEKHTSELHSPYHLVFRLLLEKIQTTASPQHNTLSHS